MSEAGPQTEVNVSPQEAPPVAPPGPPPGRSSSLQSLQSLATTIVIALFVITFIVQAFQIPSESMEKTLLVGDYLLVDKAHYGHSRAWGWLMPYRPIHRQDIIVFRYPVNPKQHFVKRVVAIPGDHLRLVDKHVYVNGVRQEDQYATFNWAWHDKFRDNFPAGGFYGQKIAARSGALECARAPRRCSASVEPPAAPTSLKFQDVRPFSFRVLSRSQTFVAPSRGRDRHWTSPHVPLFRDPHR